VASIYKRTKRKNEPYTIQYVDHLGKRRTKKGFTDKGLTEELAAKLESEARLRTSGLVDPIQDKVAIHNQSSMDDHLRIFAENLAHNSPKYTQLALSQVRRVLVGCGFHALAAIDGEEVQRFLRKLRRDGEIGHRTYNHYLQAIDSFCNWCVRTKRLSANPLVGLERLNTAVDVRHQRRALSTDDVFRLLDSARSSGIRIQGYSGEERARIYLISYMTGLRRKELASLTARSFALDASPPTVTIEATCSKHRRKDVLPLHPELVSQVRLWLQESTPTEKLFPQLDRRKTWRMVKQDLERVGIPYENDDGIADFHAAGRHTHITELLRNGASLPEARALARHSDVNTTMRYTHIGIGDQAKAVANLKAPAPKSSDSDTSDPRPNRALQMRCNFRGAESQSVTTDGTKVVGQKRENPCRSKGLGDESRSLSLHDKIGATGFEPATS
jgi:site-specific recombinase XerD